MNSFSIIRSIFFTVFVVATIAIADHSKKRTLSIICCIAVFAGLFVFDLNYPAENFFYGFKTAEQAFFIFKGRGNQACDRGLEVGNGDL